MAKTKVDLAAEVAEFEKEEEVMVAQEKAAIEKKAAPAHPEAQTLQSAEMRRRALKATYNAEPKMALSVSPMYRPYFGDSMRISINGFAVYVPCDGRPRQISKSFAAEGLRRIAAIDDFLLKKERRSDVSNNFETSPGELKIT